jgi:hypothetical protein
MCTVCGFRGGTPISLERADEISVLGAATTKLKRGMAAKLADCSVDFMHCSLYCTLKGGGEFRVGAGVSNEAAAGGRGEIESRATPDRGKEARSKPEEEEEAQIPRAREKRNKNAN